MNRISFSYNEKSEPAASVRRAILFRLAVLAAAIALLDFSAAAAQEPYGELRGKVTQSETSEPLLRATISIVGTKLGGFSDLTGVYSIRKVPTGTYTVRVTYTGFNPQEISGVTIGTGVTKLDVVLTPKAVQGKEVVITATAGRGTEQALLNERKKSATISDGISVAQIRRAPDATSGDALARVTGISVSGSRFVSVRGANERYNSTRVNGVSMVSTEPDRKAFSFDLFPANLLENMVVTKTFTPDLPGDFSGGMVQLNTMDFPDQTIFRVAVSGSYSDGTTFESVRLGRSGGTDYLGIDDGLRALPAGLPETPLRKGVFTIDSIANYSKLFPNTWNLTSKTAPFGGNLLISYGDRFSLFDNELGTVLALTYKGGYANDDITRRDEGRFNYTGVESSYSTLWGGVFNLAYKLSDLHQISVNNTYSLNGQNKLTFLQGPDEYTGQERQRYGIYFQQRELYTGQVAGKHQLPDLGDIRLEWRGYTAFSSREEPDFRRLTYLRDPFDTTAPFVAAIGSAAPSSSLAGRYYSDMNDELFGFGADVTIPVDVLKVKIGGVVENKQREFSARHFGYIANSTEVQFPAASIDTIFAPDRIGTNGYILLELTEATDKYDAHGNLTAGYLMLDYPFAIAGEQFRVITGFRVEDSRTLVNTINRNFGEPVTVNYETTDILPSVNLVYQITSGINLRGAFSKTVLRPEIREYAAFTFYEFTTDQLIYGNPDIKRAVISNYDLRFEFFPDLGELFAVSLFYKDMKDAIEAVALRGDIPERTWANSDKAKNIGIELEARKSLSFISEALLPLSVSINYTWLDSKVEIQETELSPAESGRRLQGQAPYMINTGLYYDNPDIGTSVSLLYNRMGERIHEIGRTEQPNFVEQPRDVVDFSIAQTLYDRYEIKLSFKDLLGQDLVYAQNGKPSRVDGKQMSASLGFTLKW